MAVCPDGLCRRRLCVWGVERRNGVSHIRHFISHVSTIDGSVVYDLGVGLDDLKGVF